MDMGWVNQLVGLGRVWLCLVGLGLFFISFYCGLARWVGSNFCLENWRNKRRTSECNGYIATEQWLMRFALILPAVSLTLAEYDESYHIAYTQRRTYGRGLGLVKIITIRSELGWVQHRLDRVGLGWVVNGWRWPMSISTRKYYSETGCEFVSMCVFVAMAVMVVIATSAAVICVMIICIGCLCLRR